MIMEKNFIMASTLGREFASLFGSYINTEHYTINYFADTTPEFIANGFEVSLENATKINNMAKKAIDAFWTIFDAVDIDDKKIDGLYSRILVKYLEPSRDFFNESWLDKNKYHMTGKEIREYEQNRTRDLLIQAGLSEAEANNFIFEQHYLGGKEDYDEKFYHVWYTLPDVEYSAPRRMAEGYFTIPTGESLNSAMNAKKTHLTKYPFNWGTKEIRGFNAFVKERTEFRNTHECIPVSKKNKKALIYSYIQKEKEKYGSSPYSENLISYLQDIGLSNGEIKKIIF